MAGFVLLDLWKLCADEKAKRWHVGRGSYWLASQNVWFILRHTMPKSTNPLFLVAMHGWAVRELSSYLTTC